MALTPGDTAYGQSGDYFAGIITQSGKQITAQSVWMGRYKTSGGRVQEAPVLLTNVYGTQREPMADGIWCSSAQMLEDERTTYKTMALKSTIMADLAADPDAVVLDLNHGQTFLAEMLEMPAKLTFAGDAAREDRYSNAPAFVTKVCKGVAVFEGTCIVSYHPGLKDWKEIKALMSQTWLDELSPAPSVPFLNPFGDSPVLHKTRPFERIVSEDGKAHCGSAEGFVCAVEYKVPGEDIMRYAELLSVCGHFMDAHHVYQPSDIQPSDIATLYASTPYWSRDILLGHRDLILSNNIVEGGIDRTTITRLIYITA